uniref:D-aminoacyl-tRNA deacylase n=1 Tax=candidate division WOR-3 bacterium TaxID=2052148 RepID=A0A7C4U9C3_UNCW3
MRCVIQRVKEASVIVENKEISSIKKGLLILLGVQVDDKEEDAINLAKKIPNLRIFERDEKFNDSLIDVKGEALVVSQFTLLGRTKKGLRPDFILAEKPERASYLYKKFIEEISKYVPVKEGIFGAKMEISLINDGPVTIIMDTREKE